MAKVWHATEALSGAIGKTKELLFDKFNVGFWLRLGLIAFLIGGGSSGSFNFPGGGGDSSKDGAQMPDILANLSTYITIIVAVIAVILIIVLIFSFINSVCQFMFIEVLATGEVELLRGFKRNLEKGFSLFLFNLGISILTIILLAATVGPLAYYGIKNSETLSQISMWGMVAVGILIVLIIAIIMSIVGFFIRDFAIVIAYQEGKGMIDACKRLWTILKTNVKQFIVYILIKVVLGLFAGVIMCVIGLIVLVISIVILIVIGLIAVVIVIVLAGVLNISKTALMILLIPAIIIAVVYMILVSYLIAVITLPVSVFFRYYSIIFLQHIDPKIKVLAEGKKIQAKVKGAVKEDKPKTSKKKKPEGKLKVH
jgi:hypothetical protein